MSEFIREYLIFYQRYAINWWNHLTPFGYLCLLCTVGISGYLLMLRGPKRIS